MANNINNLAISKFFGTNISHGTINRKDISIPSEPKKKREDVMKRYEEIVEKKRHSGVVDKIKATLKKGTLSDKENKRREDLTTAFKETKKWMEGFSNYFWFCKDNETTEKYLKKINKDYKALKKKGYVPEIPDKDFKKFSQRDRLIYGLDAHYLGNEDTNISYASHIVNIYKDLCGSFYQALNNNDGAFKNAVKLAETSEKISSDIFKDVLKDSIEIRDEYEKQYSTLEGILKNYKTKSDSTLNAKKKNLITDYTEGKEGLERSIRKLGRFRSRATFAWVYADYASTNIALVLNDYIRALDKFYKTVTGKHGEYSIKNLRDEYVEIKDKRIKKVTDGLTKFLGSNKSNDSDTTISDRINDMIEKVEKAFEEIIAEKVKFYKGVEDFVAKYEEWKKEQKEKKTKVTIYAVLATFGVLCTAVKAFFPLIDAALNVAEVPVNPAGGQPQ